MMHEDAGEQFVIRLKEADYTNGRLERRIIELADGSSVAEISRRLAEGLDQVWATWIKRHTPKALQGLEQRGFIQTYKTPCLGHERSLG